MSLLMRSALAGLILFSAVAAFLTMPKEYEFANGADEGRYYLYARAIREDGVKSIPQLLQGFITVPNADLLPHPGRIGHMLMTGLWIKVFPPTYRSLAIFSFVCFLFFLWISFYFARKYLGLDPALWYTVLLSSSPLLIAASRRVLQDSLLNLFWGLPFWFFFDYLMSGKKRPLWIFCAALALAITIKEQSIVLIPFFAVAWLIFRFKYQKNLPIRDFFIAVFVPPAAAVVLLITFLGGVNNFITLVDFVMGIHLSATPVNSYPYFAMGPWFKFLIDFMLLSPVTTLLFVGYFFHLLFQKKLDAIRAYHLTFFVIIFGVFSSLTYTKIVRFVVSLDIVMFLFAVFALQEVFNFKNKRLAARVLAAVVCLIFFMNMINYGKIYINTNTYDPITVWLLLAQKILPYFVFKSSM